MNLSEHTTKFGGKDYVMVSGRVLMAHAANEVLSIETDLVKWTEEQVIVKATVTTGKGRFVGHAASNLKAGSPQEKKTPLEVAETSAVGRALGFAGFAIEAGIASAEEMQKGAQDAPQSPRGNGHAGHVQVPALQSGAAYMGADDAPDYGPPPDELFDGPPQKAQAARPENVATEKQVKALFGIGYHNNIDVKAWAQQLYGCKVDELTKAQASALMDRMKAQEATA